MQRCNKNKPRCFKKMNMLLKKKDTKQVKEGGSKALFKSWAIYINISKSFILSSFPH